MAVANPEHPARLLISSSRKPISYVPAAKRLLQEHGEVHLSALGIACSSMVTVAEILKSRKLATEKRVGTMLELLENEPRPRQKPKMEVLLVKSAEFDELVAAEKDAAALETAEQATEAGGADKLVAAGAPEDASVNGAVQEAAADATAA
jgi:DNA-binding protein